VNTGTVDTEAERGAAQSQHASGTIVPLKLSQEHSGTVTSQRLTDIDEWGRSESFRSFARRGFQFFYDKWFRVRWEGLEKVPTSGGALLVANHAGAVPMDAPIIMHGIEQELGRPVYGLADHFFRGTPVVGTLWSRLGGVPAHPDNAYRLLRDQQQLALVFPEGTKGTSKVFTQRYRLRRFGRGGFVEIAMRSGVPIVPIAVMGSEETMPIVFNAHSLARMLGVPYVPVTANMLLMGPLGLFLSFPAKITLRVLDPVHFEVPPDQTRYSKSRIMDEAESIRISIQEALFDMLAHRDNPWLG
jgi:1-acyl-sn-glycerol-3-phosphate acyltransferase